MDYQVRREQLISKPLPEVFRALGEGRLFMNTGADSQSMKIDFRVGGRYEIHYKKQSLNNFGEFLEIIPDRKIVFSWCQTFGPDQKPDTQVSIELFSLGDETRLVLVHTGFKDKATCDNHENGWSDSTHDFAAELGLGTLRMLRTYSVPVEKLFATLMNPANFFGSMGDLSRGSVKMTVGGQYQFPTANGEIRGQFMVIEPNRKIEMSWLSGCKGALADSKVTLNLSSRDGGNSAVELVHTGLISDDEQKAHRFGWEQVTKKIGEVLS